ncbi:MAG: bifunctional phosphoribosylaminoimidazolecarboxamide formyltransferase/IMP cyclohydrolase [Methanomassiliicoccales archaeon]|jgi:phosphoribosylaminoimidazolecarboxamide formyltransferase/IMP cyclohydrolase|nr:bifunctional phosphoribosylaminoimidazolecarboxamide formyltransferase/IMP cyclohydrolase [Methanomassiliicoccales archaeon]
MVRVERALLSVSNKDGLVDFAKGLRELGVEIISTGGTAALLEKNGIKTIGISEVTGWPEMLDGRVKTLHPAIHAGILARRGSKDHMAQLHKAGLKKIDMVVVNLYPFKETVLKGAPLDEIIENIDIGGPSLIRAAAKNYEGVAVVTNPARYPDILQEMRTSASQVGEDTLRRLALEAYRSTAVYDAMISSYLARVFPGDAFPSSYSLGMDKAYDLRYGENPQQTGAFYVDPFVAGVAVGKSEKLHGREISYNNILDLESALELLREFPDRPTAVVIKHTNPCGIASSDSLVDAFVVAYNVDSLAAFGCVIGLNREVDLATAEQISSHFVDCVIAPEYAPEALALLSKKKNIRLLRTGAPIAHDELPELKMKKVKGGLLVQTADVQPLDPAALRVVTARAPTEVELESMLFAWKVCKHVWSNAIILAKGERVVGIGAGQMSRVDSSMIAAYKAKENARGSVMASDAFFPFRDGIDEAARAGVTAVIQPGGSIRDEEVIKAANEHGMAMVFTGVRIFRH